VFVCFSALVNFLIGPGSDPACVLSVDLKPVVDGAASSVFGRLHIRRLVADLDVPLLAVLRDSSRRIRHAQSGYLY